MNGMPYSSIKKNILSIGYVLIIPITLCLLSISATWIRTDSNAEMKIVSVNGAMSEIICGLGLQSSLVGVDVTSTYPESLNNVVKIGHNRSVSAEGIIALTPSLVVGMQNDLKPTVIEQLTSSSIKTKLFVQDYSVEGTKKLITDAGVYFNQVAKATSLIKQLEVDIASVKKSSVKKKVLFIYARGAGSMMVSGTGTSVDKIIDLSGAENAISAFADFKPLTSEALIAANPDVILLFDSGLESIGGIDGLLKMQGIAQTNAGKNKKIITMDGQLLTGFGPRLGKAMIELSSKLY